MANELIQQMQNHLDAMTQVIPGENIGFWYARDLQESLGSGAERSIDDLMLTRYI